MTAAPSRSVELDALRGFALFGIVLGNVMWFSGYAVAPPEAHTAVDRTAAFAIHVLVDGKFYSLFSLMFGMSFALQLERTRSSRDAFASLFRRRLAVLAVIGVAHAVFLWFGDIVSLYAVTGVALIPALRLTTRRLFQAALVCLAAPTVLGAGWVVAHALWDVGGGSGYGPACLLPAFAIGDYTELFEANWAFLRDRWILALMSSRLLRILGMFLLGAAAVRSGIWTQPRRLMPLLWVLVPIALLGNIALAWVGGAVLPRPPSVEGWLVGGLYSVAVPAGCLVYAIVGLHLGRRAWFRHLAPAGRMSLTHYLGQSAILALLFYGVGLGWWGRVGALAAAGVGAAVFAIQLVASSIWLRRFRQGPVEALWRYAVYRLRL